jgi:hypothetical protein
MLVAGSGIQASQGARAASYQHPASALPYVGSARAQPPAVTYDEQVGMTFSQSFSSASYNVTAVQQTDSDGYGPGYLLNGVTDSDYWYQIGIAYNWPGNVGYVSGWAVIYEVWDNNQNSIFPSDGGGGLANLTGPVNNGDKVQFSLSFSGGQVQMTVKDWNTGATGSEPYAAFGSTFVGLNASSDANGYFTGPMTEWYHVNPYFATDKAVTYYNPKVALTSADVWADEFNANTQASLFGSDQPLTFTNPNQLLTFSTNGAEVHADAYVFITGAVTQTTLSLGYSVTGGGSGYSAPTLTYVFNGTTRTAKLTGSLVTYMADAGSTWSVSANLPGGSSTERWATSQTGGAANSAMTESIMYYHQYLTSFVYRVSGGGTGYTAPSVQSSSFGSSMSVKGNTSAWTDAAAAFTYPAVLPGSSSSERWATQSGGGTVIGSSPVAVQYQLQYGLVLGYSVIGGGAPTAPTVSGTLFGKAFSSPITNSTTYFVDPGSMWTVPAQLPGSNSQERWVSTQVSNGTASAPVSLVFSYHHQYSLEIATNPAAGGSTSQSNGWVDAGSAFQLSQIPSQGWKFEGWTGSGSGSFTGPSNSTSIVVGAPITEMASYYPGLNIQAGANGAVTYTYGATSGTVQSGSSQTLFAAPGTNITLGATPSSFLYSFTGWGIGATGSGASTTMTLSSPTSVEANFSINVTVVAGISGVIIVAAAALLVVIRPKRRAPAQN